MNGGKTVRLTWQECLVQALLLVALLALAYPGTFFRGELISSADILFTMSPWDQYAPEDFERPQNPLMFDTVMAFRPDFVLLQQSLRAGELPLWNPLENGGVPLMANCQSSVFYPSRLILLFTDVDLAMTLFVLLKLWICGMTAYLCGRILRFSKPASRFFSVAWMCGGFCLTWANWPVADAASWIPVLFAGVELILERKYRQGFFAATVGATLLLFAGYPEAAFTMSLGLGFYFLLRLLWERRWGKDLWMPLTVSIAAWAVALTFCAVQLFPFVEYLAHSETFLGRVEEQLLVPLAGGALLTFWVPRFFGTASQGTFWDAGKWNSNLTGQQYPGLAVWCGVALLFVRAGTSRPRSLGRARIGALAITAVFLTLLAVNLPTLQWIHELPVLSSVRELYHIWFVLFIIPLLGVIGLDRWFSRPRRLRELAWLMPLVIGVAGFTAFLLQFNRGLMAAAKVTEYVQMQVWVTAGMAVATVLVLAVSCLWYRPNLFWGVLTALLAIDLLIATRGIDPTLPRDQVFPTTQLTAFLQAQEQPCRIGAAEGLIIPGTVGNYGIEEWLGYDGLYPEYPRRFQAKLGPDVWNAMEPVRSIRYFLHNPLSDPRFPLDELTESGALEFEGTMDGLEVYKNRRAFPRAFLAAEVEVIPDRDALFARMLEEAYDPGRVVVTPVQPGGELPHATADRPGSAAIAEYTPNRVVIDVDADEPAVLVLSDSYFPGWKATVSGVSAQVFPAYYAFRGVLVPKGKCTVEFSYQPWTYRAGLAVSTFGLLAGLAVAVYCLRQGRGRTNHGTP